jgi:hypothetical protein
MEEVDAVLVTNVMFSADSGHDVPRSDPAPPHDWT